MRKRNVSGGPIKVDFGELNPKQAQFCASRTLYTAYGGARGGGKTHVVRIKAVGGALKFPGLRVLIVRKTYPELQSNHIEPIIKMVPPTLGSYNGQLRTVYYHNGSIIRYGHYQSDMAESEYQGQEFDWIFMDEATQFTERQFRTLGGLLRGVNDFPKRFYLTCNPGGVGHQWVKRLFIDRKFKASDDPEECENPEDYSFIAARVEDNTHLMKASPAYVKMLASLPEHMKKAHRYGDWDALSGAYFHEFSESIHVIDPFKVPDDWVKYRSFDYGLDMLACYWIAVDYYGRCYVYRELTAEKQIVSDASDLILGCTLPEEKIACTFAPPDIWSTQKDTGKTMAEKFMECGIGIIRASNNRVQGHLMIKELLKPMADGKPGLLITKDCQRLIEDMKSIQADEKNPNDCAKQPHEITHTVDGLRYFAISRSMSPQRAVVQDDDEDDYTPYDEFMTGGAVSAAYLNY